MLSLMCFWQSLVFISLTAGGYVLIEGTCIQDGQDYQNRSIWHPDPCTVCQCLSPVAVCDVVRCSWSYCNSSQGGYMYVPAHQCCPVCVRSPQNCQFLNRSISSACNFSKHNEEWLPKPCQKCLCRDGRVYCQWQRCPYLRCNPGTVQQFLSSQCCPQCAPIAESCTHGGQTYEDGEVWSLLACVRCSCRNGRITCYTQQCPMLSCDKKDVVPPNNDQCCPYCTKPKCIVGSNHYLDGELWHKDSCTVCNCFNSRIVCIRKPCLMLKCKQGERVVKENGQCCPQCVSIDAVCLHQSRVHYSGSMWNVSKCDYCQCYRGEVTCHQVKCDKLNCAKDEFLFYPPGNCCPICTLPKMCHHLGNIYPEGSVWYSSQCQLCICDLGKIVCYIKTVCVKGLERVLEKIDVLTVAHGEKRAITSDVISFRREADISVLHGPTYGEILISGKPTRKFNSDDLLKNNLVYVANDSNLSTSDAMVLRVNGTFNIPFHISFLTRPIIVSVNEVLQVDAGGQRKISSTYLKAVSISVNSSCIVYKVVTDPKYGELMIMEKTQSHHLRNYYLGLRKQLVKFSQEDINDGRVLYEHNGGVVTEDNFTFRVNVDCKHGESVETEIDIFKINIAHPQHDAAPTPTVTPGLSMRITVSENQAVPITPADLSAVGIEEDIHTIFRITKHLPTGHGVIEHISFPKFGLSEFSQEDLFNKRIIYRPPVGKIGKHAKDFTFNFIVENGATGAKSSEYTFTFHVFPTNNQPPKPVQQNAVLEVGHSMVVPIMDALQVTDEDTPLDDLQVLLMETPGQGAIMKINEELQVELRMGDSFMYSEVLQNVLYYSHQPTDPNEQRDAFSVSVTDMVHEVSIPVTVVITQRNQQSPVAHPDAKMSVSLQEGTSVVLLRETLAFVDTDFNDQNILLTISKLPQYGSLVKTDVTSMVKLQLGDTITQEDINKGLLKYLAATEVGFQCVTDVICFNVSDVNGNTSPNKAFMVVVTPVNNQPPVVQGGDVVYVSEGGQVQISALDIIVTDADSRLSNITIIINTLPAFGSIETLGKDSKFPYNAVSAFKMTDLIGGKIFYNQNVYQNIEPREDGFLFYVTDGLNISPMYRFNISIEGTNDEKPQVFGDKLSCTEGHWVLFSNASFYIQDLDTEAEDLIITLLKPPKLGFIRKKEPWQMPSTGIPISRDMAITYQDILEDSIVYTHEVEESATMDVFVISVTDGSFSATHTISIDIWTMDDETPRITINRGIRIPAGSSRVISTEDLLATDVDSINDTLVFTVTKLPTLGTLYRQPNSKLLPLKLNDVFPQSDILKGWLLYSHSFPDPVGADLFKFDVADSEGNTMIDQSFIITIIEDKVFPEVKANEMLPAKEGVATTISSRFLSASDANSEPMNLKYTLSDLPLYGQLELVDNPGTPIVEFTQQDLSASAVVYVHDGSEESNMDKFTFAVSDGTNQIYRTFRISIIAVDDSLPVVSVTLFKVPEGTRKTLTEFDLRATDADSKDDILMFTIVKPPVHGSLDVKVDGKYRSTNQFTMSQIYDGHVSYSHDGSETNVDLFKFVVSDGRNSGFMPGEKSGNPSMEYRIRIMPQDDNFPLIITNTGLSYLKYKNNKVTNIIGSENLLASDRDTPDDLLLYTVTVRPHQGQIEDVNNPGVAIYSFSQADINNATISYVLTKKTTETQDFFTFNLADSKPNKIKEINFHVKWSIVGFPRLEFNVSETSGVLQIPIRRVGNTHQYSIVTCRTTSSVARSDGEHLGFHDFIQWDGQVQFDEYETLKSCPVTINDDLVYEGHETFYVELIDPLHTLINQPSRAQITIYDPEDEPVIEFSRTRYDINETEPLLKIVVTRKGDLSEVVSVICTTVSVTAIGSGMMLSSGSDYKSRTKSQRSRVIIPAGHSKATCDVRIIDDSLYEQTESFQLELSDPSFRAKIGYKSRAYVTIIGPNDEPTLSFSKASFTISEDIGKVNIPIIRRGADISQNSSVWCATQHSINDTAIPGEDYIPQSHQVNFASGQQKQVCAIQIKDDEFDPQLEGIESFTVFLSLPSSAVLGDQYTATIYITDSELDVPTIEFENSEYVVSESEESIQLKVIRSGDLRHECSVICYTRQYTAKVMMDFTERVMLNSSRVTFKPGEKVKDCIVGIVDDHIYEAHEVFYVKLMEPMRSGHITATRLGFKVAAKITITNDEDAPTMNIAKSVYTIYEPKSYHDSVPVMLLITRIGDLSKRSSVRCSTRDGSAISGIDYLPRSKFLHFEPGVSSVEFAIHVLHNKNVEWHETFTVMLGPDPPINAVIGDVAVATVTIIDQDVSASLILPAPPVVVSLLDYEDVKSGLNKNPSPSYPLICVTACDSRYHNYAQTGRLCSQAGVNQTQIKYEWEVATPLDTSGSRMPFQVIRSSTLFASVDNIVLDSIYYRPGFSVRCVVQPVGNNGAVGVPIKSHFVVIGLENGVCKSPIVTGQYYSLQGQSFVASLEYVEPVDELHPNTIHISVKVPHQDGMIPMISTLPLHNLRFLLADPVFQRHHVCSNFASMHEDIRSLSDGFLVNVSSTDVYQKQDDPLLYDNSVRETKTLQLYKHLNLKKCIWTFHAWYHMTELIDLCGASVVSDFQIGSKGKTYVSIRVPLYVSYVYATSASGWASLEHVTTLELSFQYDTVLWRSGLQASVQLGGRLQLLRVSTNRDGKLVIEFNTETKFKGLFVLSHHSFPGYKSEVIPPPNLPLIFDLELVWSRPTYTGPQQQWKATSSYSLKDYSGIYTIQLLPCLLSSRQYNALDDVPDHCVAKDPQKFTVPISYQQTLRPVPVIYTLNTYFQILNNKHLFLQDPRYLTGIKLDELDFQGEFAHDEVVYGRVLWDPKQDLKASYRLNIQKVFLCTGKDGYVPLYDPTGEIYGKGPQYGCITSSNKLQNRFLILDRGSPHVTDLSFNSVPFSAKFVSADRELSIMDEIPGMDGFVFHVEPLYKVNSGEHWYLQVVYDISAAVKMFRHKRETYTHNKGYSNTDLNNRTEIPPKEMPYKKRKQSNRKWIYSDSTLNGTNIKVLNLTNLIRPLSEEQSTTNILIPHYIIIILTITSIVVLFLIVSFLVMRCIKKRRHKHYRPRATFESTRLDSYEASSAAPSDKRVKQQKHYNLCKRTNV